MTKIRVTKEFSFEMAHVLWKYDGPCRNVHGHSYRLFVTLAGMPVEDTENPKNGMVIDFGDLKSIVNREIVELFDHTVVVSRKVAENRLDALKLMFGNVMVVDYQPTCENLVADIAERLNNCFPGGTELHSLKLYETATSYAEWFAADQKR
jgi:6-pyruvoyltetrahydropterin/6-carboxytetrahydropterin synthase